MTEVSHTIQQHILLTRRYFMGLGAAGMAGLNASALGGQAGEGQTAPLRRPLRPELEEAIAKLEYLTREENFRNAGRGTPPPHTLPPEKLREVGLHRDTWQLEVVADSGQEAGPAGQVGQDGAAKIENPLSKELGTALDFAALMKLAEKHAVRFMSVMTCTNGRQPFGMGLWEGVPLREVIWLTRPVANIRRVHYYGYHNNDPKQKFQSSLPMDRVLEDPPGGLPVILAYKLNNEWLTPKRGGPVRMLVPDLYANKSVKWLQKIILSNNYHITDTYATWNNDTESHIKTCARFIAVPKTAKAGQPIAITGVAQVGISGLSKVQYCVEPAGEEKGGEKRGGKSGRRGQDGRMDAADWREAVILPPPEHWGGGLPDGKLPEVPLQINPKTGKPHQWPLPNAIVHWAALLEGLAPGRYEIACRTIDARGYAQPMPRPYLKSGHNAIERMPLVVEG
ncbi:MAG: molybdopterin-dependent oxidoreductase [Candidatus Sumerlaeia bacterium]|nr:molybdopterin-dependent oxidoreductase [Candidatus Sumerlaeia bacterium]